MLDGDESVASSGIERELRKAESTSEGFPVHAPGAGAVQEQEEDKDVVMEEAPQEAGAEEGGEEEKEEEGPGDPPPERGGLNWVAVGDHGWIACDGTHFGPLQEAWNRQDEGGEVWEKDSAGQAAGVPRRMDQGGRELREGRPHKSRREDEEAHV